MSTQDSQRASSVSSEKRKAGWSHPGLSKECKKLHPIKDCDVTSDEEKARLLKTYCDSKKKVKSATLKRSPKKDCRWNAFLNDSLDVTSLGDFGADEPALPWNLVKKHQNAGETGDVESFDKPLALSSAINSTNAKFSASAEGFFTITVFFPCGSLCLHKVEFLIVNQEMSKILLGRPLLKCRRNNLDSQIQRVQDTFNEADISQLMARSEEGINSPKGPAEASRLKPYSVLRY